MQLFPAVGKRAGIKVRQHFSVFGSKVAYAGQRRICHAIGIDSHLQVVLSHSTRNRKLVMMGTLHSWRETSNAHVWAGLAQICRSSVKALVHPAVGLGS